MTLVPDNAMLYEDYVERFGASSSENLTPDRLLSWGQQKWVKLTDEELEDARSGA